MSSNDHLHNETDMFQVENHLNLPSVQYLVHCLDTENDCHYITKGNGRDNLPRHNQTVLSLLANNKKHSRQFTPHLSIEQ